MIFNNIKPVSEEDLEDGEEIYVVQPLNTLHTISEEVGMTIEEIQERNGLRSDKLQIGQQLIVTRKAE